MPVKISLKNHFKTNLNKEMQNRIKVSFKINPVSAKCRRTPHKTKQLEQIAQELVQNTGKLTFKNSCFP